MNAEVIQTSLLNTPVLFLVFNRPDTTIDVFETIRQAKPPRLYVAADGPRPQRAGESEVVAQVRQIATAVDWPCEVKTLFRETNLGCKQAVSDGINWFFKNEEQGIILEDDCLPSPGFFEFCEKMLARHKDDSKVGMVSGFNPFGADILSNEYFLSKNPSIWGWATWSDRWQLYDIGMSCWREIKVRKQIRKNMKFKNYLYYRLSYNLVADNKLDTWDYQWTFCIMQHQLHTLKSKANLIKNIGTEGAHAVGADKNHNVSYGRMSDGDFIFNEDLIQDQLFYKYKLPSIFTLLAKNFLYEYGLYFRAKEILKSFKFFKKK